MGFYERWEEGGLWLDTAGAFLFLAVGLFFLLRRPQRVENLLFAVFALGHGFDYAWENLWDLGVLPWAELDFPWLFIPVRAAIVTALVLLAHRMPVRDPPGNRLLHPASWIVLAVAFAHVSVSTYHRYVPVDDAAPTTFLANVATQATVLTYYAVLYFSVTLASRYSTLATTEQRAAAVLAVAVGLQQLVRIGLEVASNIDSIYDAPTDARMVTRMLLHLPKFSMLVVVPLLWALNTAKTSGPARATAMKAAIACCAAGVVGLLFGATLHERLPEDVELADLGIMGLCRMVAIAVLAYAVLRHQLFDIDIKLKWTLSRGTMAALFLGVFFVAAQLAQNFLSEQYGWAMGGVAAGVLLFAITPIQRLAESISDKAMPNVRPEDEEYVLRKKRETYRNAYAAAWSDGSLTPKDVRMLAEFKEGLGLPDKEYTAIEKDWAKSATGV